MRKCLEPYLGVLCLVIAAAAASGIAVPVCAQERGDSVGVRLKDGNRIERRLLAIDSSKVAVHWRLDDHVYSLKEVTQLDVWRLGQDRADESFRRLPGRIAWTPRVQGLNFPATSRWAARELAPNFDRWTVVVERTENAGQQPVPLPAYDDMGNPITRAEIEARMRSGAVGEGVGGLIGGLLGGGLGLLVAINLCPIEVFGPGCSPRDEAYATVAVLSGLAWGIFLGASAGSDSINRWEALEQIRAERLQAPTGGGQR